MTYVGCCLMFMNTKGRLRERAEGKDWMSRAGFLKVPI